VLTLFLLPMLCQRLAIESSRQARSQQPKEALRV
jgi:hypothetical protein